MTPTPNPEPRTPNPDPYVVPPSPNLRHTSLLADQSRPRTPSAFAPPRPDTRNPTPNPTLHPPQPGQNPRPDTPDQPLETRHLPAPGGPKPDTPSPKPYLSPRSRSRMLDTEYWILNTEYSLDPAPLGR